MKFFQCIECDHGWFVKILIVDQLYPKCQHCSNLILPNGASNQLCPDCGKYYAPKGQVLNWPQNCPRCGSDYFKDLKYDYP